MPTVATAWYGPEPPFRAGRPTRRGADPDAAKVSRGARSHARRTPAILMCGSRTAVAAVEPRLPQTGPVRRLPVRAALRETCSSVNDCRNAVAPAGALRSPGRPRQQAAGGQMQVLR